MNKVMSQFLRDQLRIEPRRFLPHSLEHHLIRVFRLYRTNCVIDVGANTGQYGRMLRNVGYEGRIVSFEPVKDAFDTLKSCRPRDRKWIRIRSALGNETGSRSINVASSTDLTSFLRNKPGTVDWGNDAGLTVDHVETVPIARLDSVFDDCIEGLRNPSVHLKLDTQGWDIEVIRGANVSLPRICSMQSEISVLPIYEGMMPWLDALSLFLSNGFAITELVPVSNDRGLRVIEFDAVMVRRTAD
jgi:FkbM family methyltransferase